LQQSIARQRLEVRPRAAIVDYFLTGINNQVRQGSESHLRRLFRQLCYPLLFR
jgi:hypothetical protein